MKLVFVHGWGFDSGIWRALTPLLPQWDHALYDRGYFGKPSGPLPTEPCVAIAHSFGAMRMLARPPAQCLGMVAINGFDRFTGHGDRPGIARRVVDRMIDRFGSDPARVLDDFRRRCGTSPAQAGATATLAADPLLQDLVILRDEDRGDEAGQWSGPLLSLQGALDPILPADLRADAFRGAAALRHQVREGGGHLLPLTDAQWCADAVRGFIAEIERDR